MKLQVTDDKGTTLHTAYFSNTHIRNVDPESSECQFTGGHTVVAIGTNGSSPVLYKSNVSETDGYCRRLGILMCLEQYLNDGLGVHGTEVRIVGLQISGKDSCVSYEVRVAYYNQEDIRKELDVYKYATQAYDVAVKMAEEQASKDPNYKKPKIKPPVKPSKWARLSCLATRGDYTTLQVWPKPEKEKKAYAVPEKAS